MGCFISHRSELEYLVGESLNYKPDVSNETTAIYISSDKILWKVCTGEPAVIRQTFLNNYRVKRLTHSQWLVQPKQLFKLSETKLAISMVCYSTDLFNFTRKLFNLNRVLDGMQDIAEAMAFLHSKGLAHRDIKPENIVIGLKYFRLIDFDFTSPLVTSARCGTAYYICPRRICDEWKCSTREYSIRCDMYAFGKTIVSIFYYAALVNAVNHHEFIVTVFKKQGVLEKIDNPFEGNQRKWFDIALQCCQKIPALKAVATTDKTANTLEMVYADEVAT